jgi:hypothetical protein
MSGEVLDRTSDQEQLLGDRFVVLVGGTPYLLLVLF